MWEWQRTQACNDAPAACQCAWWVCDRGHDGWRRAVKYRLAANGCPAPRPGQATSQTSLQRGRCELARLREQSLRATTSPPRRRRAGPPCEVCGLMRCVAQAAAHRRARTAKSAVPRPVRAAVAVGDCMVNTRGQMATCLGATSPLPAVRRWVRTRDFRHQDTTGSVGAALGGTWVGFAACPPRLLPCRWAVTIRRQPCRTHREAPSQTAAT